MVFAPPGDDHSLPLVGGGFEGGNCQVLWAGCDKCCGAPTERGACAFDCLHTPEHCSLRFQGAQEMTRRIDLGAVWQGQSMPQDTADACVRASAGVHALGGKLELASPPRRKTELTWESVRSDPGVLTHLWSPEVSALPTGREVHFRVSGVPPERGVQILWGTLVPLGFVPWDRFPLVSSPTVGVFHHVGPWRFLLDHHMATGRGELAWSSFCAAAQADVGMWEGRGKTERFIQGQLYRLGLGHGPVDGVMGDETRRALGRSGMPLGIGLAVLADRLAKAETKEVSVSETRGQILFGGRMTVQAWGRVEVVGGTPAGASFTVGGPGRVVLDFEP